MSCLHKRSRCTPSWHPNVLLFLREGTFAGAVSRLGTLLGATIAPSTRLPIELVLVVRKRRHGVTLALILVLYLDMTHELIGKAIGRIYTVDPPQLPAGDKMQEASKWMLREFPNHHNTFLQGNGKPFDRHFR